MALIETGKSPSKDYTTLLKLRENTNINTFLEKIQLIRQIQQHRKINEDMCRIRKVKCFDFSFNDIFINLLNKMAYPNTKVACFSNAYRDSSMWGHYADNHKGQDYV